MPDKKVLVYTPEQITARVAELGAAIRRDYAPLLAEGEQLLAVGVLNGAFIFMADLVRAVGDLPVEVDFVRLSSYQDRTTSSSEVVMTKNLEKEIRGRHVLVVEDIADCGLTLAWLLAFLKKRQPASVRVAVAVDKRARRETPVDLDYVGFSLDDGFLVGYGLDYAEKYRNLPAIYEVVTPAG
ncbi:MAG: hypoxanthine phosphoribosyltransferase [Candidatus Adiutrix sp.]|jgi:hypoxanthine phosphoribosyltransferase|nr:hypoxanthine phosphoribosyltransferase [Candidatus Adiutrix sp.]